MPARDTGHYGVVAIFAMAAGSVNPQLTRMMPRTAVLSELKDAEVSVVTEVSERMATTTRLPGIAQMMSSPIVGDVIRGTPGTVRLAGQWLLGCRLL